MKRSTPESPSVVYSCFKEPRSHRLYKIKHTATKDNGISEILAYEKELQRDVTTPMYTEHVISETRTGTMPKMCGFTKANVDSVSLLHNSSVAHYGTFEGNPSFSYTTEVLIVNFTDSLYPYSLESLDIVQNEDNKTNIKGIRKLTLQQNNSLVQNETYNIEIESLRHEISACSGNPLILVFTYDKRSLDYAKMVFDKCASPYAVSPMMASVQELVVYLKTLTQLWKKCGSMQNIKAM